MTDLEQAIKDEYGPDPHLGEPYPETIAAIANLVRSMIRVSKKRPAEYKDEPWLRLTAEEHARHGASHMMEAYWETDGTYALPLALDADGELHSSHAALRLAFYEAKLKGEK